MKRFCLILILLLILAALSAGCTEEREETTAQPANPTAAVPERTDANGSYPQETGQANTPAGDPQTTTAMTTEVPFSGMEIEDSYVETVEENVGIGGN